jgi:hypothetical protein
MKKNTNDEQKRCIKTHGKRPARELLLVLLQQVGGDLLQEHRVVALERQKDVVVVPQGPKAVDRCVPVAAAGLPADAQRLHGRRDG